MEKTGDFKMTKEGPARQLSSLGITRAELVGRIGVKKAVMHCLRE
tara:strand:+ start:386 stop:520 length:135 start_codon:yes stop_codon:yes gene_type:complete